ncbi:hypothetical protein OIU77_024291 [Salix suchowensis]|uniref:Uncharacterized protein n=1 Tax=Salix suchowensis TaxID=1278906 RepID=A0ABQ9BUD2_9ROSI|nr:hypothetical protein OIU77_024291 [Salix suchowensis]
MILQRKKFSFSESYNTLFRALRSLLVPYDFFAGRLVPALEDNRRLEIDCNGAGVVVAAARTGASLSQLGGLFSPKPNFKQLVAFLSEEGEDEMELKDKPLLYLQFQILVEQSSKLGTHQELVTHTMSTPNPVKLETFFFSVGGTRCANAMHSTPQNKTRLFYIPPLRIDSLKMEALKDGNVKKCTTFHAIAAKVWKARSIATKMHDEVCSTMLFPVDVRRILVPPVPIGFAGNALVPRICTSKRERTQGQTTILTL